MGIMLGPQARKERAMRRLLRCGLALVLVMAALPTGDRTAHAAGSILTEILRRGTVRIAIAVATRPLRFEDENGNLQGYEIDIATRLAKDLGVTIDWIKTNAAGRVAMLQTKQADITIASFTPNLERLKTIGFTDPYSTAVLSLLSRTDRKDLGSPTSTGQKLSSLSRAARPWRRRSRPIHQRQQLSNFPASPTCSPRSTPARPTRWPSPRRWSTGLLRTAAGSTITPAPWDRRD